MKIDLLYQHNLVYAKLLCCWPSRFTSATNLGAVLSSRGWVCWLSMQGQTRASFSFASCKPLALFGWSFYLGGQASFHWQHLRFTSVASSLL